MFLKSIKICTSMQYWLSFNKKKINRSMYKYAQVCNIDFVLIKKRSIEVCTSMQYWLYFDKKRSIEVCINMYNYAILTLF